MKLYRVKQISRTTWQIIGPSGVPVHDDAPYGKDRPIIYRDEDKAIAACERMNLEAE